MHRSNNLKLGVKGILAPTQRSETTIDDNYFPIVLYIILS